MYLLEELWRGEITPSERAVRKDSPYHKISHEATDLCELLRKELSSEGKKLLDEYHNKQMQLADISLQDAFIRGVRIGAQFVLDVTGKYESQLPQVHEV